MEEEKRPIRVVTATALFDGHDAAINLIRRLLLTAGAEVIHLGHDRSVDEIVTAALEEDADAIAVSSYQGGHLEFYKFIVDELKERGGSHIRVFGGGGGVISPDEIKELVAYGVEHIFTPEDGRRLGLRGMIHAMLSSCARHPLSDPEGLVEELALKNPHYLAELISYLEEVGDEPDAISLRALLDANGPKVKAPVIGFTGTGGAGKSSVVDEIVRRYRLAHPKHSIGIVCVDPSRRRTGGALLGDRIRMNSIHGPKVYFRSLATRQPNFALSSAVSDAIRVLQCARFDLIVIETAGIGQSDSEIVDRVDVSTYVMTSEYGAPSQLEKIDMVDLADLVVLNKFDRQGSEDALRDVRKQWRRNREEFDCPDDEVPVFPTIARYWNDPGMDRFFAALESRIRGEHSWPRFTSFEEQRKGYSLIPPLRQSYLSEIADTLRKYCHKTEAEAERAREVAAFETVLRTMGIRVPQNAKVDHPDGELTQASSDLWDRYCARLADLEPALVEALRAWPERRVRYAEDAQEYTVRDRTHRVENYGKTLSQTPIPKVALPQVEDWGDLVRFLRRENLPGSFPFTAGVFPFKREDEDPTRMFAGEGTPERTNRRFHLVAKGQKAVRLSTAFDSVTLYGREPKVAADVYGKVGTSGVSVCTLDDAKRLYSGFDLLDPKTSVSLTINGPAPVVLAFFFNAAIDQAVEKHLRERGDLEDVRGRFGSLPEYRGVLPKEHSGLGLGLLGIPGAEAVDAETYARIRSEVLKTLRGTVQADILKEDQAQNTCIFSTEFALRLMGDVQEYFIKNEVRNFYSVSISGYHMAEAGANPITQLAFTLANAFTYCEYYLARGMAIDDFAKNFSFFFSNGLDAEYSVIGRVARRIWAVAMRDSYKASERSQKLKCHIQTSGRSLHDQDMAFNDIRTTLQALTAIQDCCNSLHTNAFDEALTTPTEASVRRAVAIQLIINREFGVSLNENPIQGSYFIEALTDVVEAAVLDEFDRLSQRGGVLGAMETLYQRGKIQDESHHYEVLKDSGALPIIGVNTFIKPKDGADAEESIPELMRATEQEKRQQLKSVEAFQKRHAEHREDALRRLKRAALEDGNVFEVLMEVVQVASLGEITEALFEAGGQYRRCL